MPAEQRESPDVLVRQKRLDGDNRLVDYADQTVPIMDAETGDVREAQIFVITLRASNHTGVQAT